tara:strand:- start:7554 stop:7739 length:186 start_codon:yes stop_codon:yes gene_type:complete
MKLMMKKMIRYDHIRFIQCFVHDETRFESTTTQNEKSFNQQMLNEALIFNSGGSDRFDSLN